MATLLRPADVQAELGLSRTKTYELIANGTLPAVRIGRSVRVPAVALQRWIDERTERAEPRDEAAAQDRSQTQAN